jgi:hypothetical protein
MQGLSHIKIGIGKLKEKQNWNDDNITKCNIIENIISKFSTDLSIVGFREENLIIETVSSVVMQDMMIKRRMLLDTINEELQKKLFSGCQIKNIKFIIKGR